MGVLSNKEEGEVEGPGESGKRRSEVFLRIKQRLLLEVDMQCGRERCRLELSSLVRVESTEAAWTRGVRGRRGRCKDGNNFLGPVAQKNVLPIA